MHLLLMLLNENNPLISQKAIFIYIAILFILIVVVIMVMMTKQINHENYEKDSKENTISDETNTIIKGFKKEIDEGTSRIERKIQKNTDAINLMQESGCFSNTLNLEKNNVELEGIEISKEYVGALSKEVKASEKGKSRFTNLTNFDNYYQNEYKEPNYNDKINLHDFCEAFRNFSARELKLYYSIQDIRRFVAGLSVTKLIILQGMSGTGKTSMALAFGKFLENTTTVIPIQPMWKERTDLIGYYNEFTKEFNETDLLNKMYEANYTKQIYITVLDEMNIARVEYYFAEFLSLLEIPNPEERNLTIVSSRWENDPIKIDEIGKLRMPINMWFIGTANNDDSTFAISDKVYDRAMVINLDTKAERFEGTDIGPIRISSDYYYQMVEKAQLEYELSERNKKRIAKLDKYLVEKFHITFGNRIMKQINAYVPVLVACGGTELEGIDDILSRKVLRKLESKNPVYVKSQAEALINKIDEIFGTDKMPLCKEAIQNIEQNS